MLFRFPGISLAFYASFRHPFWFLLVSVSTFVFVYGFVFVAALFYRSWFVYGLVFCRVRFVLAGVICLRFTSIVFDLVVGI